MSSSDRIIKPNGLVSDIVGTLVSACSGIRWVICGNFLLKQRAIFRGYSVQRNLRHMYVIIQKCASNAGTNLVIIGDGTELARPANDQLLVGSRE